MNDSINDREPLAYAYEGDELYAVAYKKQAVWRLESMRELTVSRTPEGEDLGTYLP